jgi:hypothetical protein
VTIGPIVHRCKNTMKRRQFSAKGRGQNRRLFRPGPRCGPRHHRLPPHRGVERVFGHLRPPLAAHRDHGGAVARRHCHVGIALRLDVAVSSEATWPRPGDVVGAVRGYSGRCDPIILAARERHLKEPGSSYSKPWRCVSGLGLTNGGLDSLEFSPYVTLSRGAFSASSLVTPIR